MRGLPYSVVQEDICTFFKGHPYDKGSIKIAETKWKRPTGESVLLFDTEQGALDAMNDKQGKHMGTRYIELFQIS